MNYQIIPLVLDFFAVTYVHTELANAETFRHAKTPKSRCQESFHVQAKKSCEWFPKTGRNGDET